ncbi:chaplin family protein [Allonocardiopsis opalescens]|uniref:Small secreted domain DUF320 n=1 Tax=Allonocardiopsis opalescens TaxID=1144618 RepID=A0A2T0Q207_9ACTN|nr:chaplin family protein [Allonocardiopsis opalescens]PRX97835.1 small secreted domain DUF320 [Allonocardiopsis opalescens]
MLKKALATSAVVFATLGFTVVGAGAASADLETTGHGGILSGNNISIPTNTAVNVSCNSLGLFGAAGAYCSDSDSSATAVQVID